MSKVNFYPMPHHQSIRKPSMAFGNAPLGEQENPPAHRQHDPEQLTHADIRWRTTAENRVRRQRQKYYNYKGVLPSWVGQQYYDIIVVSQRPVGNQKSSKSLEHHSSLVGLDHFNHNALRSYSYGFSPCWFLDSYITSYIELARSEARHITHSPRTKVHASTSSPTDTFDAPFTLTNLLSSMTVSLPTTFTSPHLKFKLRTWTKQDNFDTKEHFRTSGVDIRHSRGKRRVGEKHLQKRTNRHFQRDARTRTRQARDVAEESWNEQTCGGLHGSVFDDSTYAHVEESWYTERHWRDDLETNCCCIPWKDTRWGREVLRERAPFVWDEDESVVYWPAEEAWHEVPASLVVAIPLDVYVSCEYHRRKLKRAHAKSMAWPEEESSDCGSVDEDFWIQLGRSLNSSEIILGSDRHGASTIGDYDAMSDVVDIGWDVLSESSFLSI